LNLGVFGAQKPQGVSSTEIVAGLLSLLWLAMVILFLFVLPVDDGNGTSDPLIKVMMIVAIFLPLALIWVAAVTARTSRMMREEAARLQASVDAMRNAYVVQARSGGGEMQQAVEQRLDRIAQSAQNTETTLATFTSRRDRGADQIDATRAAVAKPEETAQSGEQPSLALGTPSEVLKDPLSMADFIKALNFPESEKDTDGFRALRLALEDREIAKLIRASEDILTLLSHDGIYMDDLSPDRAKPEVWRKFATGERGRSVAGLAGVRDRSCLALTSGRLKADPIFRDAAHHFLRQFDKILLNFEKNASDQDIANMSETRTARAFMLLGRVAGTFD